MALFEITINLRLPPEISAALAAIQQGVQAMTQEVEDLKQAVTDVKAAVGQIPGVIDAFEARITAILANSGMSQEDKDAITQATADLRATTATALAAVADANDGTDEGAPPAP